MAPARGEIVSHAETVVERLIPESADRIIYRATVTDPLVYTRPRTNENPLNRDDGTNDFLAFVGSTIQFHGPADRYSLNGATAIATLYTTATASTPQRGRRSCRA